MGKNFVITRPRIKSVVSVHSNPRAPFKAVVSADQRDIPLNQVRVLRLLDKQEFIVDWNLCKHSSV